MASVVLILGGAIAGGWIMKKSEMATVLWIAAAVKAAVTIGWWFWQKVEDDKTTG